MCGRYTLIKLADFINVFPWIHPPEEEPLPRYNIAPSQPILAVANDEKHQMRFYHWGLVPSWAKDPSVGYRMINARAETISTKPAYRSAFKRRRCIIPADGFYEWRKEPDGKTRTPMYIRMKDSRPFAFAGLWEVWRSEDGSELPTCTIITGLPNELVANIHDRMPVILSQEDCKRWLDPGEQPADALMGLLKPYPAEEMDASPVGRAVNNPRHDSPKCIQSVADQLKDPEQPTLF